ncbi:unnamed protein product [Rhizoctonia solani]|uniref:Uncharacterized protein n=1 Tax=Rhizoctonia solani TaxID=456999 RepID=A0A8H3C0V9_9AGAM|nr:unnamed protein product [Rhizoctonia solani]
MQTLAHNGMAYFAALVGIMILACVAGVIPPLKIAANGSGVLSAIASVVCSHMVFSLYRTTNNQTNRGQTTAATRSGPNEDVTTRFAIPLKSVASSSIPSSSSSRPEQA